MNANFEELIGKTIVSIDGKEKDSDSIIFKISNGETFHMFHDQGGCELVFIDDVCGDVDDLINSPIKHVAEKITFNNNEGILDDYGDGSFTRTCCRIATSKGHVDIKWYGRSDGYYPEHVYFQKY